MATVTLVLADSLTREDGSAVTTADIASLNIYRATGDGPAALVGSADPKASPPTFVDANLTPGTYAYAASEVGTDGRESKHSDLFPVVIAAPPALLNAPTIVSATVS